MRALNGDVTQRNYRRLLTVPGGGKLAYQRVELAQKLTDREWIDSFAEGTVGAAYRHFLDSTGYSADGLVEVSMAEGAFQDAGLEHPYAWMGRRERDIHDLWHVLTGYKADEHLGEACLVAFSYAQTGGMGWAFIALGASLKSIRVTGELAFVRAVLEGYRAGKRAAWLHGEDYEALLAEPIEAARKRLRIEPPVKYRIAQERLAAAGLKGI
jgi:ubiquinone biosynthesis protein COQ4